MEDKTKQIRHDLYQRTRDDLLGRNLSNSENLDRAILTLSSAALALSVTGIRYIVDLDNIVARPLLITVWMLFVVAIISTLLSFHASQLGIKVQLDIAERYYMNNDEDALNRTNKHSIYNERLSYLSTCVFIAAIICFVIFISLNMTNTEEKMSDSNEDKSQKVSLTEGAQVPKVQAVPKDMKHRGANIPKIQVASPTETTSEITDPAAAAAAAAAAGSGESNQGSSGEGTNSGPDN